MNNQLESTGDGSHTLRSEKFDEIYHSKHGAIQESQTVFIDAGLSYKALVKKELAILEIGFGTGLNALMTYLEAEKNSLSINYKGIEAYPISTDTAKQLNYPEKLEAPNARAVFEEMHQSENQTIELSPNFTFHKSVSKFEEITDQEAFDIIYYDAFAPNTQAHLWETEMLHKMYQALKTEGVLVTYCAKGSFKRALKALGFTVEALPGPKGKREMTRAVKN